MSLLSVTRVTLSGLQYSFLAGQPARGDLAAPPTWLHWVVSQWSLRWPLYGLRQAPREWHDTLRTTLVTQGFTPSTADQSLFLPTETWLTLFYVLVYIDDLVFATADTEAPTLMKSFSASASSSPRHMAAQELRWLTYVPTDLVEQPRSPPVLYVDNKAMIVLCQEHRLEHRTKHIALRYFLARELQQRGQLRLVYVR
ncbi:unnamed protein product [Closterium sp. NIES-53]